MAIDRTGDLQRTFRLGRGLRAVFALLCVVGLGQRADWIMPTLYGCLLVLALAAGVVESIRKWAFTIWIVLAVVTGMVFPTWFIQVGDYKLTRLFVPLLQVIMFCMGTTLSVSDFARVFRMPIGVIVGVGCQFTIMPIVGFVLAKAFGFPPEIAAGIVLVGSSPSGLASNVMAYIAKADVAMSVTLTAVTTLMAPIMTPYLMQILAGQMIQVDTRAMMLTISKIVLIPVIGGLVFHHVFYDRAKWLNNVLPVVSMAGIIAMTVLTVAVGRDNLIELGIVLLAACFLHSTIGYMLGYFVCSILRLNKQTCRTIALEVGMQNSGMASGIAAALNKVATLGLAPIVFGPVMNTTASILANWWRTHPVIEGNVE